MSTLTYSIADGDYEHGGSASRLLKNQLKKVGADPAVIRRAMIAVYEAEMNVVIHARGGELRATLSDHQLEVEIVDQGPGIPDIERAMQPGFSTASAQARQLGFGAGMGLPNIRKASDEFTIESTPGVGTRIRFTVRLKPQALYGEGRHSVHIVADKCQACLRCLHVCPTRAVRVFRGKPQILDYLCVDCAACVATCPTGAFTVAGPNAELTPRADVTLVVPPAVLVQYGPKYAPARVLAELQTLGYGEVVVTAGWETALRAAVVADAATGQRPRPVISPVCPAVVNLIETRYPALIPHLAPWLSPFEAVGAALPGRQLACVVTCLCQRTVLLASPAAQSSPPPEIILPATLRAVLGLRLKGEHDDADAIPVQSPVTSTTDADGVLRVAGVAHVASLLERIEDGQVGDVQVVEPYACNEGEFGSPLLAENPCLARHRWEAGVLADDPRAQAMTRDAAYTPRPGLRLDADMAKAVQKMGRIDKLARSLPGDDCGLCGAPTCMALAEDIVLGRAADGACRRPTDQPKERT